VDDNIIQLAALQDSREAVSASEDAMALAFAERHEDALRYVAGWGKWMLFDGVRWKPDSTLAAICRSSICVLRSKPTNGTPPCCARAASGQAVAPPTSAMNSRRFSRPNCIRLPLGRESATA
jgi:hypothetical protein